MSHFYISRGGRDTYILNQTFKNNDPFYSFSDFTSTFRTYHNDDWKSERTKGKEPKLRTKEREKERENNNNSGQRTRGLRGGRADRAGREWAPRTAMQTRERYLVETGRTAGVREGRAERERFATNRVAIPLRPVTAPLTPKYQVQRTSEGFEYVTRKNNH